VQAGDVDILSFVGCGMLMSNHYHIVGGRLGDYGKRADRKTLGQLRLPFIESRVGNVGCSFCNESSFYRTIHFA
jgi:hypothetical protein